MNFKYEQQASNTFLVYTLEPNEKIDSMTLGMLTNNKMNGVLPALFTQMDDERYIKYNVTGRIVAKDCFSSTVNKKRIIGLFRGIIEAMQTAEDYMFDSNSILLDLRYMYMDVTTSDTRLISLPIEGANSDGMTLSAFIKEVLFKAQFDQSENCDYVAKLMNFLNSTPQFDLGSFASLLASLDGGEQPEPPQQKRPAVVHRTQNPQPVVPQRPAGAGVEQPDVQPYQKMQDTTSYTGNSVPPPVVRQMPTPEPQYQPRVEPTPNTDATEQKHMSMWYLLNHYSKENLEAYRAQKGGKSEKPEKFKKNTEKANKNKHAAPKFSAGPGFAIPGQEIPMERPVAPAAPVVRNEPRVQQPVAASMPEPARTYSAPAAQTFAQGTRLNFGETTTLVADKHGETTLLVAKKQESLPEPHLIRTRTKERISLNKEVFRVGKEQGYVDYYVDNPAVSRSHANIVCRSNGFFIVDTNSKNHTFLNGRMIQSNTEVPIMNGDSIRLADEEFEFYL